MTPKDWILKHGDYTHHWMDQGFHSALEAQDMMVHDISVDLKMTEIEVRKALELGCQCGSGLESEREHDGHGIYLGSFCDECRKERLKGYRSDIFENYECEEPIDED